MTSAAGPNATAAATSAPSDAKGTEKAATRSKISFHKLDVHTHILPEQIPDFKKMFGYGDWIHLDHHTSCKAKMMKGNEFFREIEGRKAAVLTSSLQTRRFLLAENCYRAAPRIKDNERTGVTVQVQRGDLQSPG